MTRPRPRRTRPAGRWWLPGEPTPRRERRSRNRRYQRAVTWCERTGRPPDRARHLPDLPAGGPHRARPSWQTPHRPARGRMCWDRPAPSPTEREPTGPRRCLGSSVQPTRRDAATSAPVPNYPCAGAGTGRSAGRCGAAPSPRCLRRAGTDQHNACRTVRLCPGGARNARPPISRKSACSAAPTPYATWRRSGCRSARAGCLGSRSPGRPRWTATRDVPGCGCSRPRCDPGLRRGTRPAE